MNTSDEEKKMTKRAKVFSEEKRKRAKGSSSYLTDEEKKITKRAKGARLSYLTDEENRKMKPRAAKVSKEEEKTRCIPKRIQAKRLYFSDLTEEEVMALFHEGPRFRFELCSVVVNYKNFGKPLNLFGVIQAAERPGSLSGGLSPDPASHFVFSKIFNREYNDPLVVPNTGFVFLQNICFCAIRTTSCVQIIAELYVTTEKVDDVEKDDDYYNEVEKYDDSLVLCEDDEEKDEEEEEEEDIENNNSCHNVVYKDSDDSSDEFVFYSGDSWVKGYDDEKGKVTTTEKEENDDDYHNEADKDKVTATEKEEEEEDVFKVLDHYDIDHCDSWFLKGKNDDVEKDNDYHNEVEDKLTTTEEEDIENEAFEVCNEYVVIELSDCLAKRPFGSSGYNILKGQDGSLELYYVLLKYTIDASLEVEFVATSSKEPKVYGWVKAYYGKDFDYMCHPAKHLCRAMLFETEPDDFVKPGKINLMRSVLPVPAQFSLIISAYLHDSSGDIILLESCEFPVPRDGSSCFGALVGNDCSLKLKVDWKLPPDMRC